MTDTIATITATVTGDDPAVFVVDSTGDEGVGAYGTFTYQWDVTTNTLVGVTGTFYGYDDVTGVTTTFTNPIVTYDGSVGGVAQIQFQTSSGNGFSFLTLDWVGKDPSVFYTGSAIPGGASVSSITKTVNGVPTAWQISPEGSGGTITTDDSCFAAGTLIATTKGEIAVEALAVGDVVVTADGAEEAISWLGHRDVKIIGGKADQKYLVRIAADAVAPGLPRRDLLVTQEHCLLLDGVLVPARMLVNDTTITLDRSITSYTYYHVELARHAVILAEGLATESYLDTGNRGNFANADMVAMVPAHGVDAGHGAWRKAAAPLAVDRATVEPIWRRLADRAAVAGLSGRAPVLTEEHGLHLVTDAGQALWPVAAKDGRFLFMLPPATDTVRLRSRASRPSDVAGPFVDDRRMLGVNVGSMTLTQGRRTATLQVERAASGWHVAGAAEAGRWTNGDAALKISGNKGSNRLAVLEIQLLAAGPYVVEEAARLAA
jgi:hypothetical protein